MRKNKVIGRIAALICCMCLLLADFPVNMFAADIGLDDNITVGSNGSLVIGTLQELTTVNLEVEIPLVGFSDGVVIYRTDYDGYTVEAVNEWCDAGGYQATQFINETDYSVLFRIIPKEGYTLTANTQVTINGETVGVNCVGGNPIPASQVEFKCQPTVKGVINEIHLSNMPIAEIGQSPNQEYSYVDMENHYSAMGTWFKYNVDTKTDEPMADTDTFLEGGIYKFWLRIQPDAGYIFTEGISLYVDGDLVSLLGNNSEFAAEYWKMVNFATQITEISIAEDAIPKAVVGESFTNTPFEISVAEGSNYTVSASWQYIDETGVSHTEGIFENGKSYDLCLTVRPNVGYVLAKDLYLSVGDEGYWSSTDGTRAEYMLRTSFKETIDSVKLLNLPEPVVGEKLQTGYFAVSVPDDANYTAEAIWQVYDEECDGYVDISVENGTDVVIEGKLYKLDLDIYSESDFDFEEALVVNIYNTDVKITATHDFACLSYEFSLCEEIDRVEITGITEPVAGEVPLENLTIPEDANYEIEFLQWHEMESGQIASVFEQGHRYELQIIVSAKDGYEFSNDTMVYLNSENTNTDVKISSKKIVIYKYYSLEDVISEIQISDFPEVKIGEQAIVKTVDVPGKYYGILHWDAWDDAEQMFIPFEGTFSAGEIYRLNVFVHPEEGYRFSEEETDFFIDGQISNKAIIREDLATFVDIFSTEESVIIEEVQLTVSAPVPGAHSSIQPNIELTGKWKDKIVINDNVLMWLKGSYENNRQMNNEYFKASGLYGFRAALIAKDGYVFADQVNIVVNGVSLPMMAVNNDLKECRVYYFFDYETKTVYETFADADITDDLKKVGFTAVENISSYLGDELKKIDTAIAGTQLYDVSLMYRNGGEWLDADADAYPNNGKVTVKLPVPNGTSSKTHKYTILHMFAENAFGKTAGSFEQPVFTVKTEEDGKEYLVFEITGCSPVMVGWSVIEDEDDNQQDNTGNGGLGGSDKPENPDDDGLGESDKPETPDKGNTDVDDSESETLDEDAKSPSTADESGAYAFMFKVSLILGAMMTVSFWRRRKSL